MGEALALFRHMRSIDVAPDTSSNTSVITAWGDGGQSRNVVARLRKMKTAGGAPDSDPYLMAIMTCGRAGEWKQVSDLLKELKATGVTFDVGSYRLAILACDNKGAERERVLECLSEVSTIAALSTTTRQSPSDEPGAAGGSKIFGNKTQSRFATICYK